MLDAHAVLCVHVEPIQRCVIGQSPFLPALRRTRLARTKARGHEPAVSSNFLFHEWCATGVLLRISVLDIC